MGGDARAPVGLLTCQSGYTPYCSVTLRGESGPKSVRPHHEALSCRQGRGGRGAGYRAEIGTHTSRQRGQVAAHLHGQRRRPSQPSRRAQALVTSRNAICRRPRS